MAAVIGRKMKIFSITKNLFIAKTIYANMLIRTPEGIFALHDL